MPDDLSKKTALVYDGGLFPFIAEMLATKFGRVLYYSPYQADLQMVSRKVLWGEGLPGVERTNDFFASLADADIVVFPDVGMGDLQSFLRGHGYAVWGSAESEQVELDRQAMKLWQQKNKFPEHDVQLIEGYDDLKDHMEDPENSDRFIKISEFRGDFETKHHVSPFLSREWLKWLAGRLGPAGNHIKFVSEAPIEDAIEVGYDGFFVGDKFSPIALVGYEHKDTGYIGMVVEDVALPAVLGNLNTKLAPLLKELGCISTVSTELRVTPDGLGYPIDFTMRCGSPPSESMSLLFSNMPEIVYVGAKKGVMLRPQSAAKFCAQVILRSAWAEEGFLEIRFPEEYRHLVKLHAHALVDGQDYVVAPGIDIIGSACGLGNTMEEATDQAMEVASSVEAHELEFDKHCFDPIFKSIEEGTKRGIAWS